MLPILATLSEWHVILALIIVFLLFGGKKLPELARGLGQAIKEFKKGQREITSDDAERPVTHVPPVEPPKVSAPGTPQKPGDPKLN